MGQLYNKTKIFGDSKSPLITHIVTIAKCVIYDARYNEIQPSFRQFKVCLKRDFDTERFIAARQNKLDEFNRKWSVLMADLGTRAETD